ncbi:MAG: hypothetical protein QOH60_2542 [Mycobacterium sp.]|nr:hypothetical protein [Mycobacterium sp.]
MATCPNGHENPEGPKFCGECGAAIVAPPSPVTTTQPSVMTKGDPSGQRKLVLVLAGLGLLAIAVAVAAFGVYTTPALIAAVVVDWVLIIIGVTIVVRSDQSVARKFAFGIACFLAVFAVNFLVGGAFVALIHKGSSPSSPSAHSASYQAGYQFGLTVAHPDLVVVDQVCGTAFIYAKVPDQNDYMQGCADGIHAPR